MPAQIIQKSRTELSVHEMPFVLLRGSRMNAITLCGLLRYVSEPDNANHQPLAAVLDAIGINQFAGCSCASEYIADFPTNRFMKLY